MSERIHTVKVVCQRTGLSPHVIRVWERRYQAVTPGRTSGNQRLYTDEEVARLELLRRVTEAGHSIGRVAQLPEAKLRELALLGRHLPAGSQPTGEHQRPDPSALITEALGAIEALEPSRLEAVLTRAATTLGQMGFLNDVVAPLAHQVGEAWEAGRISAAHEHMASTVIRAMLASSSRALGIHPAAPHLVVATPAGQLHEIGAAMVATLAAHRGWRVTYLGSSLPATEIAGAAKQTGARAVALSIVYPHDDAQLAEELKNLRAFLPPETGILAGGRAAGAYADTLETIGAIQCRSLKTLSDALDELRGGEPPGEQKAGSGSKPASG